ncbi:phosphotransferase [Dactylosporangium sp. NPDC051484]|uniref:phosphotransferase n=1 Tax=Dactylosporangium sp. NPDC051484 TaxID=3154942 RepID=UPI00344CDE59
MTAMESQRSRRLEQIVRGAISSNDDVCLDRLTGGASRETLLVTLGEAGRERRYVLRIATAENIGSGSLRLEADAMAAAAAAGVPVPRVHVVGSDDVVGGTYMLMDHVDGETIARRILREDDYADARVHLAGDLGKTLGRIHGASIDSEELRTLDPDPILRLLASSGRDRPPDPGLALGVAWLRDNRPPPASQCLVHGDLRLGNFILGREGLRAVLDWELAHIGDPVEDIGWLCAKVWRFGSALPAAGVGTRDELLDGYESVTGWRPSAAQVHWWELYATIRWGLGCALQADRHLSGAETSIELLAIGRRAAEQEFDVLLGLGLDAPFRAEDVLDKGGSKPHGGYGRPTADDLAAGVEAFLESEAIPLGARFGFNARIAANVMRTLRRELRLRDEHGVRHRARLERLGVCDDEALGRAILDGSLSNRYDEVIETVRASVRERLLVSNPLHLSRPA